MICKTAIVKIDRAIKEIWRNNISKDYWNDHLLKEDTLKNSFYYHLRRKLGTQFLEENNIRIYTEFCDGDLKETGFRADIAIVELSKDPNGYLGDNIESSIAIIELKFGGTYKADCNYYDDINKIRGYIRDCRIDCLYYLGFIAEKEYENPYWLDGRQTNNWADKRVTVLSANLDVNGDGIMHFYIQSCNGLNKDLDDCELK